MESERFTPWMHWKDRASNVHAKLPGVYLLARFEDEVPTEVDLLDRHIILIGETHGQTLHTCWGQFQRSAFAGKWGHSGGVNYHILFGNGIDSEVPHWLYVSATPGPPGAEDTKEYVRGIKAGLLHNYEEAHGLLPACNLRKGRRGGEVADSDLEETIAQVQTKSTLNVIDYLPLIEADEGSQTEPEVHFGRWQPWSGKYSVDGMDAAGVYALGCFEGEPPTTFNLLDEGIVYIGETCNNTLGGRLYQFDRSAFQGKSGHSGGLSFGARCPEHGKHLHVAILPVSTLSEPRRSTFIRHVERKLLWDYVQRFGRRPLCNSK